MHKIAGNGENSQIIFFRWDPVADTWSPHPDLTAPRLRHLLIESPNADDTSDPELHPVVLGEEQFAEIYLGGAWGQYKEMPGENWNSLVNTGGGGGGNEKCD